MTQKGKDKLEQGLGAPRGFLDFQTTTATFMKFSKVIQAGKDERDYRDQGKSKIEPRKFTGANTHNWSYTKSMMCIKQNIQNLFHTNAW